MAIWRQLGKVDEPFQNYFENSTYDFEITPISKSHTTTLGFHLLHLKNCVLGTPSTLNGLQMTRNQDFFIFFFIFK